MKKWLVYLISIVASISVILLLRTQIAAPRLKITVTPSRSGPWIVSYKSNTAIKTLQLSDDLQLPRKEMWDVKTPNALFHTRENLVTSRNGVREIVISFTPVFAKQGQKTYSPFIEFSKKTVLAHSSGFVVKELNAQSTFTQQLIFNSGEFNYVSLDQETRIEHPADKDSYILFSSDALEKGSNIIFSESVPSWLRQEVELQVGTSNNFFSELLGDVGEPVDVFISSDLSKAGPFVDAGYNQSQIVMKYYGSEWNDPYPPLAFHSKWILFHEMAHHWNAYFQVPSSFNDEENIDAGSTDSWLYEGGAEMLSIITIMKSSPTHFEKEQILTKARSSLEACANPKNVTSKPYACGLAIQLYANSFCAAGHTIANVWQEMFKATEVEKHYDIQDFLNAVKKCGANQDQLDLLSKAIEGGDFPALTISEATLESIRNGIY